MSTYCILDASNLMHRARRVVKADDEDDVIGLCLDIAFRSIKKIHSLFDLDHTVVAFDHRSWRKDFYGEYKANRLEKTDEEQKITNHVFDILDSLERFFEHDTNVSVLRCEGCEGDDFVARWIQLHPDDDHIIVSSDGDFKQLVASNVKLFNGVTNTLYTVEGVYYQDGFKPKKNQDTVTINGDVWKIKTDKSGEPETIDPGWELFKKIMLGDESDNISRASPKGVGEKKLKEAYDNPDGIGMSNIMEAWLDEEEKITVAEIFERNVKLVDLTQQPDDVKAKMDEKIVEQVQKEKASRVGVAFLKFCKKNNLVTLAEDARRLGTILQSSYSDDG